MATGLNCPRRADELTGQMAEQQTTPPPRAATCCRGVCAGRRLSLFSGSSGGSGWGVGAQPVQRGPGQRGVGARPWGCLPAEVNLQGVLLTARGPVQRQPLSTPLQGSDEPRRLKCYHNKGPLCAAVNREAAQGKLLFISLFKCCSADFPSRQKPRAEMCSAQRIQRRAVLKGQALLPGQPAASTGQQRGLRPAPPAHAHAGAGAL